MDCGLDPWRYQGDFGSAVRTARCAPFLEKVRPWLRRSADSVGCFAGCCTDGCRALRRQVIWSAPNAWMGVVPRTRFRNGAQVSDQKRSTLLAAPPIQPVPQTAAAHGRRIAPSPVPEFHDRYKTAEDHPLAVERHRVLVRVDPAVGLHQIGHPAHGGIAGRLVRPFDPGRDDRFVVFRLYRPAKVAELAIGYVIPPALHDAPCVLITLPALLAWSMNFCRFAVGTAIPKPSM